MLFFFSFLSAEIAEKKKIANSLLSVYLLKYKSRHVMRSYIHIIKAMHFLSAGDGTCGSKKNVSREFQSLVI